MTSTSFNTPHRPDTTGVRYTLWTEHHRVAAQGLPPCALHLWQYLLTHCPGGIPQEIDLRELRAELALNRLSKSGQPKPYSVQSLKDAIHKHLEPKGLIEVVKLFTKTIMRVVARHAGPVKEITKNLVKSQLNLSPSKETCKTDPSNADSAVPLYREDSEKTANSPAAVISALEENTGIQPLVPQLPQNPEVPPTRENDSSNQKTEEQEEILAAVDAADIIPEPIAQNHQLKAAVLKYALSEVVAAISMLQSQPLGKVKNPPAWLTDCLRFRWHRKSDTPLSSADRQNAVPEQDWTQHPDLETWLSQMRQSRFHFLTQGTCFDKGTRTRIANWAEENNLVWVGEYAL